MQSSSPSSSLSFPGCCLRDERKFFVKTRACLHTRVSFVVFLRRDDKNRQTKLLEDHLSQKKHLSSLFASREDERKSKISSSLSLSLLLSLFLRKNEDHHYALLVLSLFLSFSLSFGWLVHWLKLFRFEERLNLRVKRRVHSKKPTPFL